MLKGMFAITRNNWALEKAGIKTQMIDPTLRMGLHRFGMQCGMTPEEVAAFYIRYDIGPIFNRMTALETVHGWAKAGKLRANLLIESHIRYVKQGFQF